MDYYLYASKTRERGKQRVIREFVICIKSEKLMHHFFQGWKFPQILLLRDLMVTKRSLESPFTLGQHGADHTIYVTSHMVREHRRAVHC